MAGKLNKEEIQKIVLGIILLVAIIYAYFNVLLGPLGNQKNQFIRQIEENQKQIQEADSKIRQRDNLRISAKESTEIYELIKELTPDGSPVAWVPLTLRNFFENRYNLAVAVRPTGSTAITEPLLRTFTDTRWVVELPQSDFVSLGNALAALENSHPLIRFTEVQILASSEELEFQRASLNLNWRLYDKR